MTDRRRINPPLAPTSTPVFATSAKATPLSRLQRTRAPNEIRKIFLKTGLTPSASGSAYLELEPPPSQQHSHSEPSFLHPSPSLKLTCTVHGPRPLPRSVPFSPHLLLSAHVKYAPFASRQRRGYVRDASERDLSVHLETSLRGIIISERWPKSGVDVVITILEGEDEEDARQANSSQSEGEGGVGVKGWGMMSVLAGCITVASAAITDAGIDCVDLVTGGVAAVVRSSNSRSISSPARIVLDPYTSEEPDLLAVCVVGYLQSRDELTEIWTRGNIKAALTESSPDGVSLEVLIDKAVEAASASRLVLEAALKESTEFKLQKKAQETATSSGAKRKDMT
ncbi:MAG: hypothetical protein Q9220_005383 [cf. Caloplaca sp. 1 TL-2023]